MRCLCLLALAVPVTAWKNGAAAVAGVCEDRRGSDSFRSLLLPEEGHLCAWPSVQLHAQQNMFQDPLIPCRCPSQVIEGNRSLSRELKVRWPGGSSADSLQACPSCMCATLGPGPNPGSVEFRGAWWTCASRLSSYESVRIDIAIPGTLSLLQGPGLAAFGLYVWG